MRIDILSDLLATPDAFAFWNTEGETTVSTTAHTLVWQTGGVLLMFVDDSPTTHRIYLVPRARRRALMTALRQHHRAQVV